MQIYALGQSRSMFTRSYKRDFLPNVRSAIKLKTLYIYVYSLRKLLHGREKKNDYYTDTVVYYYNIVKTTSVGRGPKIIKLFYIISR